jgi:hypothetical protein
VKLLKTCQTKNFNQNMKKIVIFSILSFSLIFATQSFSQEMRLPGSGSSSSGTPDSGSGRAVDFNKEVKLKQDLKDVALSVANKMLKCCSTWGGTNVWGEVDYENVRVNDLSKTFVIPMTVGWQGSLSGNQYFIKGQLVIDKDGNKSWNKIKDSGGFSPGCSKDCIN